MNELAEKFLRENYFYTYLKGRLNKGCEANFENGILISGSSHALNGIQESVIPESVNCSMHSQDIFYDSLCVKYVLDGKKSDCNYSTCVLVMGYYMPFQDLSLSVKTRAAYIARTYYPIFHDSHNWEEPTIYDHWNFVDSLNVEDKIRYEEEAVRFSQGLYFYSDPFMKRKTIFDFSGRTWEELPADEKEAFGIKRAAQHNHLETHVDSFNDNLELIKNLKLYLEEKKIKMYVIVAPFTPQYCKNVSPSMKNGFLRFMDMAEIPNVIDFNDERYNGIVDDSHFMDMDHLNEKGSYTLSEALKKEITV